MNNFPFLEKKNNVILSLVQCLLEWCNRGPLILISDFSIVGEWSPILL